MSSVPRVTYFIDELSGDYEAVQKVNGIGSPFREGIVPGYRVYFVIINMLYDVVLEGKL